MRIICFDLSTVRTGYAIADQEDGKVTKFGSIVAPTGPMGERYAFIVRHCQALFELEKCWAVAFEELHYARNMNTLRALAGLRGALLHGFALAGHPEPIPVHQQQAKRCIGLKASCRKHEVLSRVRTLGHEVANEDEADAVALAYAAMKLLVSEPITEVVL